MLKGKKLPNGMTHYICPVCKDEFYHNPILDTCGFCTLKGLYESFKQGKIAQAYYEERKKELEDK